MIYYRCDVCKSEVEVPARQRSEPPIGRLFGDHYCAPREVTKLYPDIKHLCEECDRKFSAAQQDAMDAYEEQLNLYYENLIRQFLV